MITLLGPLRKIISDTLAMIASIPTEDALMYWSFNLFTKGRTLWSSCHGIEA